MPKPTPLVLPRLKANRAREVADIVTGVLALTFLTAQVVTWFIPAWRLEWKEVRKQAL